MAEEDLTRQNCGINKELESLREREQNLVREKMERENEFGHQRARFIELFKQKEEELSNMKTCCKNLEDENAKLKEEIKTFSEKIDEIKTESAILEVNKDDEITRIQQKFQEESASFQHILKESISQAYQSAMSKFESEREEWLKDNEKLQAELQEMKLKITQEKESTLTSLAKTLQKKVALVRKEEPENLENSMKKAQEDVELLKSVVTPLEDEISQLKKELHMRDQQIAEALNRDSNVSMDLSDLTVLGETKELNQSLQTEKASRTDLEMYVKVLNTQKEVLRNDNLKLISNLQNVIKLLEQEKLEHEDLKRTWEMANEQFLESQNLLAMDIKRLESVLNSEQMEAVSDMKEGDYEREKQEKRVDELKEMIERETAVHQKRKKEGDALRRSVSSLEILSNSSSMMDIAENLFPDMEPGVSQDGHLANKNSSDDVAPSHSSASVLDAKDVKSPVNNHASDCHIKTSEQAPNVDSTDRNEVSQGHLSSPPSKRDSSSGKRVVSDSEWQKLQIEVNAARDKLTKPCSSCQSMEEKVQASHEQEKKFQAQVQTMIKQLDAERRALTNQEAYVKELETNLHAVVENSEVQIQTLQSKLTESEKFMKSFKDHFERGKFELYDYLKQLSADREDIQKELTRLQDENDSLVDKHAKKAQEMQEEIINFPNNLDEMQHILLKYREELITCKVTLEHNTEVLKSEISFLRSRLEAEQQERNNMEETLTQELSQLQGQVDAQKQLGAELEKEREKRVEEEKNREKLEEQNSKNVQTIETLQFEVKQLTSVKAKLDKHIHELKSKIHSLQVDLDNSEDVQRDFVKLSQTLQIQLEKIRAAETEVRWQHEEDVEDCPNCRTSFSVTKRKYHCKHCGQVFCADCLCKTVNSGPNMRASRVCDVCHTMLVKDATPYFSTEQSYAAD